MIAVLALQAFIAQVQQTYNHPGLVLLGIFVLEGLAIRTSIQALQGLFLVNKQFLLHHASWGHTIPFFLKCHVCLVLLGIFALR